MLTPRQLNMNWEFTNMQLNVKITGADQLRGFSVSTDSKRRKIASLIYLFAFTCIYRKRQNRSHNHNYIRPAVQHDRRKATSLLVYLSQCSSRGQLWALFNQEAFNVMGKPSLEYATVSFILRPSCWQLSAVEVLENAVCMTRSINYSVVEMVYRRLRLFRISR